MFIEYLTYQFSMLPSLRIINLVTIQTYYLTVLYIRNSDKNRLHLLATSVLFCSGGSEGDHASSSRFFGGIQFFMIVSWGLPPLSTEFLCPLGCDPFSSIFKNIHVKPTLSLRSFLTALFHILDLFWFEGDHLHNPRQSPSLKAINSLGNYLKSCTISFPFYL